MLREKSRVINNSSYGRILESL